MNAAMLKEMEMYQQQDILIQEMILHVLVHGLIGSFICENVEIHIDKQGD